MDGFFWLLAFLLVVAILFGPWIVIANLRKRLNEQARLFEDRVSDVVRRLYDAEAALRKLEQAAAPQSSVASAVEPISPTPAVVDKPSIVEAQRPKREVVEETPLALTRPSVTELPPLPYIPPGPVEPEALQLPQEPEPEPTIVDRIRNSGGIEDLLGKNWLNKVGIVLLVMGIAFFLAHQLKTMGPAGKILVGYSVSLAMLGAGIWFERSERYRILARAGIGGGWALTFFTTYAMYHVPAAQVLTSQGVDLVLMLALALAMVGHTLRYNSQVVTALAFLLAFLTIFVSRVNVYSLTAGVVLALGIAIIAVRRSWFELEIFGVLATYLNHFFWLHNIFDAMGGQRQPFPEFFPSAAILCCYWAIYRVSYLVRRVDSPEAENISTVAALLNSLSLLALLKYQSLHPEWAFWVLLALGGAELAVGQLPITRRRRTAFAVLATIGATLVVAAIPFRYSGADISVLWIMEAEAFFLVGIFSAEIVFTRLGMLAGLATVGQMIFDDTFHTIADRISGVRVDPDYRVGLLVLCLSAVILYANAHWFARRTKQLFEDNIDRALIVITSFTAAALATAGLWMAFPRDWTAVIWSALALTLAVLGHQFDWEDIAIQANLVGGAALLRVIIFNLSSETRFHGYSLRLITVTIVAALYYVTSHYTALTFRETTVRLSAAYTWAASVLVATVIWYEADAVYMALLWCVLGVVLFQIGLRNRDHQLRWQGYVAMVAAFVRVLQFNLADGPHVGDYSARVYSVIPIAIAAFLIFGAGRELEPREERVATVIHAWIGTATIAALVWYETQPDWLVASWACLTALALAAALLLKNEVFKQHGLALSLVVLLRAVISNLEDVVPGWSNRSIAVAVAAGILFASLYFCFRLRKVEDQSGRPADLSWKLFFGRPEQTFFFVPLLMTTLLLAVEMRAGLITVSWGIEAVVVFLFALMVNERSFRLSGLALLLLCVGKIVVVDVWGLNSRDRYITFIIMGLALLLVSFLYTRYRTAIKQYL